MSLFTELTIAEQENLSGGARKIKRSIVEQSNVVGDVTGADTLDVSGSNSLDTTVSQSNVATVTQTT